VFVWCGQGLLLLLEHAHEGQDLFAQALVLVDDAAEVFAQMAQLRLGRVYALVAGLDDSDDLCEVVLCGGSFLGGCVCGWGQLVEAGREAVKMIGREAVKDDREGSS
jgi:hypothetical protein